MEGLDVVEDAPRSWPPLSRRGYYSAAETAAVLGLSTVTVARLAQEGNLPAMRPTPRGPWRFDRRKVDAIAVHGLDAVMGPPLPSLYQRRNGGSS